MGQWCYISPPGTPFERKNAISRPSPASFFNVFLYISGKLQCNFSSIYAFSYK